MSTAVRGGLNKLFVLLLLVISTPAQAQAIVLRMAHPAPDGSAFAREMILFARDVERRTDGRVKIKLYPNGVAGSETEVGERILRGQLEGFAGAMFCELAMPSIRVMRLPGLFQNRDEAKYVVNRLSGVLTAEARQAGFRYLSAAPLGADVYFGRKPIHTLRDLQATPSWRWDTDSTGIAMSRAMGLNTVAIDIGQAGRAFDEQRIDGFWAMPSAALAWQWAVRAPYIVNLHPSFIYGCAIFAGRVIDGLPTADQMQIAAAAARLVERFDDVTRRMDDDLLNGLFAHQGVKMVPVSETFRAEFFAAATAARDHEGPKLVPKELIERVRGMLADYRAEHGAK